MPTADVIAITVYLPICHACRWEGTDTNSRAGAEAEAAAHERMNHA